MSMRLPGQDEQENMKSQKRKNKKEGKKYFPVN